MADPPPPTPWSPVPPDDFTAAMVRASFESAPDGLVVFSRRGPHLAYNRRFALMWQLSDDMQARHDLEEVRAHMCSQLVDPARFRATLVALETGALSRSLEELDRIDGRVFERQVAPLVVDGQPDSVIVRWRDVTDRRRTAVALEHTRRRLAAVFDHAAEAIVLLDDGQRIVEVNAAACRLFGRTHGELVALGVADLYADPAMPMAQAWSHFQRTGGRSGVVALRHADGHALLARFSAVAHIQPGVHLAMLADVTEAERQRRLRVESAAQMEMAMASAEIVFWRVDLVADRVEASSAEWLARTLGYSRADLPPTQAHWDALVHPDDAAAREARWQEHVAGRSPRYECEFRMRHRDGHWIWLQTRGVAVERDDAGRATLVVGTRVDITRRKLAEEQLERQAWTDELTGVLNRRRFLELAAVEVSRAQRHGQPVALLMIDLDHFKQVNDRHGHAVGDAVLQHFAKVAGGFLRTSDLFGRIGGEEFAVLLPQTDADGARALADRLRLLVREHPAAVGALAVPCTVSIGVSAHASGDTTVERLIQAADRALYGAKDGGRDRVLSAAD